MSVAIFRGLAVTAVIIVFAIVLGYFGGQIGYGLGSISKGVVSFTGVGAYLLALAIGAGAFYVFIKNVKGIALERKHVPILVVIALSIIFLQWGTRFSVFSIYSVSSVPSADFVDLPTAILASIGAFIAGFVPLYHLKVKRLW